MVSEIELVVESEPEFDWLNGWMKNIQHRKNQTVTKIFSTEIDLHFDDGKKAACCQNKYWINSWMLVNFT